MMTRRGFMRQVAAGAAAVGLSGRAGAGFVGSGDSGGSGVLGRTGLRVSRLGVGTGTHGSGGASDQTRLGREGLVKLLRHAVDRGVTYFDCADQYGSHTHVREVLQSPAPGSSGLAKVDRDRLFILTKTHARSREEAVADVDRFRRELGVERIDCVLLHCMTRGDWPARYRGAMDGLSEAKAAGAVRAVGVSCHGWDPLVACREPAAAAWIDVQLARINPFGTAMDGEPARVAEELAWMHAQGRGVLGMKVFGGGARMDDAARERSLRYVLGLGTVDAFTIGFDSAAQLDATIEMIGRAG